LQNLVHALWTKRGFYYLLLAVDARGAHSGGAESGEADSRELENNKPKSPTAIAPTNAERRAFSPFSSVVPSSKICVGLKEAMVL
jgi:hypothetical protein